MSEQSQWVLTRDRVEDIYTGLLHDRRYAYYPQEVLSNEEYALAIAQAQRALTLKAVGEWLEVRAIREYASEYGLLVYFRPKEIQALKEGRMP